MKQPDQNSVEVNSQKVGGTNHNTRNDKDLQAIPPELKKLIQWVTWKLEQNSDGSSTKRPYRAGLTLIPSNRASVRNSSHFSDFETAWKSTDNKSLGIGFVFTEHDPFCFVDLDHCIDEAGNIEPESKRIIDTLNSYTEISQSGLGIHVIVKAQLPEWSGNRKGNFEIYTQSRYCAMTGNILKDYPLTIEERQEQVNQICSEIFQKPEQKPSQKEPSSITLSDQEIVEKASKAKNADKFNRLMAGQWQGEYHSHSEADLSLCSLLAFWNPDADQLDRLFRQSGLMRDKWDRADYRNDTINKALTHTKEHYTPGTKVNQVNNKRNAEFKEGDPVAMAEEPDQLQKSSGDKPVKSFNLTDYGNAERLVYYHGENIRYCFANKKWYIWNGKYWKIDTGGYIQRMAKDTVRRIYAEASLIQGDEKKEKDDRKEITSHAGKSEANNRQKAMIELAQSETGISIEPHQLDSDTMLLNCLNYTIDLRTGETLKHDRKHLITKIVPIQYDPKARLALWENFLKTATDGNEDVQTFLQYAAGYSLTGDISEEKLFFIHGPAASGKSTFIEALKSTLGIYSKTADFETFISRNFVGGIRNDIAELAGARFVSSIEVDEGKRLAEGLVKMITGGDTVRARFLYQESFEFLPQFKLWLVANHKPDINPDDSAMWRRILVIPFDHVIPEKERDPVVKAVLTTPEIAGAAILAWAVQGCLRWQEYGLTVPKKIKDETNAYRQEMDIISEFIAEKCILKPEAIVTKQMLFNQYKEWCINEGVSPETKISFGKRLKANHSLKDDSGAQNVSVWRGIGLKILTPQDSTE